MKGILHSKFKVSVVGGDGQEKPVFVGKFQFMLSILYSIFSQTAN